MLMYCWTVWQSSVDAYIQIICCNISKLNLAILCKFKQEQMSINNNIHNLFIKDIYSTYKSVRNVYIHLPFCQKKCHFCAFPVHATGTLQSEQMEQFKQKYVDHLIREIKVSEPFRKIQNSLESLYFGGGTPSLYSAAQLMKVCSLFPIQGAEVSLELNPTELIKMPQFNKTSINRFSIGIQTFDNILLQKMNRPCLSSKDELLSLIQQNRPENLSLDFIIDFCEEQNYFDQMLESVQKINPQHVTLYILQRNQGSYLKQNPLKFDWLPQQSKVLERYIDASKKFEAMGYNHYQVSNFCKSDRYKSKHNNCYWDGNRQFLAYGMGAASLSRGLRITRPSTLSPYYRYVKKIQSQVLINPDHFKMTIYDESHWKQQLQSMLMSGLRRKSGVPWSEIQQLTTFQKFNTVKQKLISQLKQIQDQQPGLIKWTFISEKISLTVPKGYLLVDQITYRLINCVNNNN